ncbi:hypothetical protein [Mycolicibacterium vanbaalenii]|uniref:Mu-like prophage I protein n=1 Tax=Mycolicibacterium vanbaalenii (strain DSM 7251 / JCM 13017 / BCRC 16820 / KCTC 9966 / NRRL B-24157 / PYR-1) TaxID=350058 RepID=A1TB52_MYCVP|nr:hypothetical protein [Mycolicibacterium vanbaalenii]ABM14402.1 hypothetical protein Mvan_3610 [Mycolicibacterium vanbaalenii PYR-1]MCV7126449.1 hypothetical protein [Mycolicibacterium vanbaalenii PYR-1]
MALELDDTQAAVLLALLGLPEDTTDVQLVIDTVKDATRDPMLPPAPSEIAAAAARNGLEVVDSETLTALRRDATAGREAIAAAARQKVEATVDAAIDRGALAPSRRTAWVDLIAADSAMADVLARVDDHSVVPLAEVGHAAGVAAGRHAEDEKWVWP